MNKKNLKITTGIILFLMGLFFLAFELLAIIDPVGTQMSDDSNPFGEISLWPYIFWAVIITLLFWGAYRLLYRSLRPKK